MPIEEPKQTIESTTPINTDEGEQEETQTETIEYRRPNGAVKVSYGERLRKEDEPNLFMREISKIEFIPETGEPIDIIKTFNIPVGWKVMATNDHPGPAMVDPINKHLRLSSNEFHILSEESVPILESLKAAKQRIKRETEKDYPNLEIDGQYNPEKRKLFTFLKGKFFERPGAFLLFAHELDHARRDYPLDILIQRTKLRKMDPKQMNYQDINDYHELVINDEGQANRSAVQAILRLRSQGIELEPDFPTKEALEEFVYKSSLKTYEEKLGQALEKKAV
ncbi:MAG: hypothetical protein HYW77_03515 [Parcubacteria group bacterium]|nr:hypothetical protein [Parcubacteria group bacterium]